MMQAPVDEVFSIEGGHAHWKSHEEAGDAAVAAHRVLRPDRRRAGHRSDCSRRRSSRRGDAAAPARRRGAHREGRRGDGAVGGADQAPDRVRHHRARSDADARVDGGRRELVRRRRSLVLARARGVGERDRPARREAAASSSASAIATSPQRLAHKPPAAGLALTHARVLDVERGRVDPRSDGGRRRATRSPPWAREDDQDPRRRRDRRSRGQGAPARASGTCTRTSGPRTAR